MKPGSWDVFCRVVDNFGDIGVCWRLARQLVAEHGREVRLWVDDLTAFKHICPEIDPDRQVQRCRNVEIRHWTDPFPPVAPAQAVVEAFACGLPERYLRAMADCSVQPPWINLEYLSAEDWVGECHGLASPSPRLPLTKHFFFPGFAANTGGVMLERDLFEQRQAFLFDTLAQADFWRTIGLAEPHGQEIRISLFCYPASRAEALFDCWRAQSVQTTCLVPEGIAGESIAAFFGQAAPAAGGSLRRGSLEIRIIPFLEQDSYDRLLWVCNCNFVRGEDSFVRAQWAQRPMVWQPYPQAEGIHLHKLKAFLRLYCKGLPETTAGAVSAMWDAWSRGEGMESVWPAFWAQEDVLAMHAASWAATLRANGDMTAKLIEFCSNRL